MRTSPLTRVAAVGVVTIALGAGIGLSSSAVAATSLSKAKSAAAKEVNAKIALYDNVTWAMPRRDLGVERGHTLFVREPAAVRAGDDTLAKRATAERAVLRAVRLSIDKAKTTKQVAAYKAKANRYNPRNFLTAQSLLITTTTGTANLTTQKAALEGYVKTLTPLAATNPAAKDALATVKDRLTTGVQVSLTEESAAARKAAAVNGLSTPSYLTSLKASVMDMQGMANERVWVAQITGAELRRDGLIPAKG